MLEVALEALVREPDRVDQPAGDLPQPRGRIALPRREGHGLRDERGEREPLEQLVAERAVRGDRVERPRPVDDRVRRARARRSGSSMPGSDHQRGLEPRRIEHRSIYAQADVAGLASAPRTRSTRRTRRPCPTRARAERGRRDRRRSPGPPRASPAARTHTPRPPRRGRRARPRAARSRARDDRRCRRRWRRRRCGADPLRGRGTRSRNPSRVVDSVPPAPSSSCQIASGAIPTPPPARSAVRPSRGGAKPLPSGPTSRTSSPASSSASRFVPGPTSSIRKSRSTPSGRGLARITLNARGRNGRSPSPPPHRSADLSM